MHRSQKKKSGFTLSPLVQSKATYLWAGKLILKSILGMNMTYDLEKDPVTKTIFPSSLNLGELRLLYIDFSQAY